MVIYATAGFIAVIGVAAVPIAAPGQNYMFETGTTLLSKCRKKAPEYGLACTAYIGGAVDGIKKDVFIGGAKPNCWPAQLNAEDVKRIVLAYLTRYPDQIGRAHV